MSFNGSFGDGEFMNEEDNTNIISLKQEDLKSNFEEGGMNKNYSNSKISNNININDFSINFNNNIFSSVPMQIEIDTIQQNLDFYNSLLSKEAIKYHISCLFNILKRQIAIINSKTFYLLIKLLRNKIKKKIKAIIFYFQIEANFRRITEIFKRNRQNLLYYSFYTLKENIYLLDNIYNNVYGKKIRDRYEIKYKSQKGEVINENNSIKLENQIKDIQVNLNILDMKEKNLKDEINKFYQKEILFHEKTHIIENLSTQKEINFLELETINNKAQLKKGKNGMIDIFEENFDNLLSEYQIYLNKIKNEKNQNTKK